MVYLSATARPKVVPLLIGGVLLCAAVAVWVCRYLWPEGTSRIDLRFLQLWALPAAIAAVLALRCEGARIPRAVVLVAGCGIALVFLLARGGGYDAVRGRSGVVVAPLSGDAWQVSTRLVRVGIEDALGPGLVDVERLDRVVTSEAMARRVLTARRAAGVVWGDERFLRVTLPITSPEAVLSRLAPAARTVGQYELVLEVPGFGVSFMPAGGTAGFLSLVFGETGSGRGLLPPLTPARESLLRAAMHTADLWRSFAHRAWPAFVLGNHHLVSAIENGPYEPAELRCAVQAYEAALGFLRPGDNPPLQAAILNNQAVADLLRHEEEGGDEWRRRAWRLLRESAKVAIPAEVMALPWSGPAVAARNFERLKTQRPPAAKARRARTGQRRPRPSGAP